MATTINQLIRKPRKQNKNKTKVPALMGCPQVRGTCDRFYTMTTKKPNSALRKVVDVTLSNGYKTKAYVVGETGGSAPIQEHNAVLVEGGKTQDIPGMRLKVRRGSLDVGGVDKRKQGRSKYGVKRGKN